MYLSDARSREPELVLSNPQREHLLTVLQELEEVLRDLRRPEGPDSAAALLLGQHTSDLPPGFARTAGPHLAALSQHLAELAGRLVPPTPRVSRRRAIHERLQRSLVALLDAGPHGLRGYGPIDTATSAELDRLMRRIRSPTEQLLAVLDAGSAADAKALDVAPGLPRDPHGSRAGADGATRSVRPGHKPAKKR